MIYPSLLDLPHNKLRQMTKDEASIMLKIMFREKRGVAVPGPLVASFSFQVMSKCLKVFSPKLQVNDWVIAFFTVASKSPGQIVMYAWMLHNWGLKSDFRTKIDMTVLAQHIIPNGLPTEETLDECWDAQKVDNSEGEWKGTDNALDYPMLGA
jgi:hypothetical protein